MTIVAINGDRESLRQTEQSIEEVFTTCDVKTFIDALSAYKYCVDNQDDVTLIFIPVLLMPVSGFELAQMVNNLRKPIGIVYTTYTDNPELNQLVKMNGGYQHLIYPITAKKLKAFGDETIAECWQDEGNCRTCIYTWCERWKNYNPEQQKDAFSLFENQGMQSDGAGKR